MAYLPAFPQRNDTVTLFVFALPDPVVAYETAMLMQSGLLYAERLQFLYLSHHVDTHTVFIAAIEKEDTEAELVLSSMVTAPFLLHIVRTRHIRT